MPWKPIQVSSPAELDPAKRYQIHLGIGKWLDLECIGGIWGARCATGWVGVDSLIRAGRPLQVLTEGEEEQPFGNSEEVVNAVHEFAFGGSGVPNVQVRSVGYWVAMPSDHDQSVPKRFVLDGVQYEIRKVGTKQVEETAGYTEAELAERAAKASETAKELRDYSRSPRGQCELNEAVGLYEQSEAAKLCEMEARGTKQEEEVKGQ